MKLKNVVATIVATVIAGLGVGLMVDLMTLPLVTKDQLGNVVAVEYRGQTYGSPEEAGLAPLEGRRYHLLEVIALRQPPEIPPTPTPIGGE